MSKRFIKLSRQNTVDRNAVIGVHLNLQTFTTVVFIPGLPPIESDFTAEQTVQMLETGEQYDLPETQS